MRSKPVQVHVPVTRFGRDGIARGFLTGAAGAALALALVGAALAAIALGRTQLPPLEVRECIALVVRWMVVGAVAGLAVGIVAAPVAMLTQRRWVRRTVVALVVVALVGAVLVAGGRSSSSWSSLDLPRDYPPLPARRAPADAPNLVLVTIDTLRRDHLDLYGYERPTAPHLATLARGGTVFETAIAQAPETVHSLASLMTGLYPHALDREFEQRGRRGAFLGAAFHTLAERLAAGGYTTAGFVSNVYLKAGNGFAQGFHHFDERSGMFWAGAAGRWKRAEHVVDAAVAWLEHAKPPFFLWLHVMDPHHPYEPASAAPWEDAAHARAHAAAYERLSVDAYTQRLKDLRADRRRAAEGEIAYLMGRYDAEILHADRQLARLDERLASRGFDARNTVLVVTADHGEEFGDHGRMLHGHTLFDELIRVPLVLRGPGIPAGRRIAGQVPLLDVTATVLDLAGLADGTETDGRTLLPAFAADEPPLRPALSFLQTHYVAYRTPEWKLVTAFEPYDLAPPSLVPWEGLDAMVRVAIARPHRPRIGLWRLADDPGERRDLATADRAAFRELYAALLDARRAHPPRAVASGGEPGLDEHGQRTLRALGYVGDP